MITLGIIGVVAAMTIPTLVTKINERQTVTKLKKAYSTLANAYRLMENDSEVPLSQCLGYFPTDENVPKACLSTLSKYLKVANRMDYGDTETGGFDESKLPNRSMISDAGLDYSQVIQTMDGFIFYFPWASLAGVVVDVNGLTGPNEGGKDAFYFYYNQYDDNGNEQLTYSLKPGSYACTKDSYSDMCTAEVLKTGKMNYLK